MGGAGSLLHIRLVLAGCEGNHVVGRIRFHTCQYSRNHYAHDMSQVVAGALLQGEHKTVAGY